MSPNLIRPRVARVTNRGWAFGRPANFLSRSWRFQIFRSRGASLTSVASARANATLRLRVSRRFVRAECRASVGSRLIGPRIPRSASSRRGVSVQGGERQWGHPGGSGAERVGASREDRGVSRGRAAAYPEAAATTATAGGRWVNAMSHSCETTCSACLGASSRDSERRHYVRRGSALLHGELARVLFYPRCNRNDRGPFHPYRPIK